MAAKPAGAGEREFFMIRTMVAVSLLALSVGAASAAETKVFIHQTSDAMEVNRADADKDGFLTRAEAQAEAERSFSELDHDKDGKVPAARPNPAERSERRVEVIRLERPAPNGAAPPRPPRPPMPPSIMMLTSDAAEYDRNGDGSLSKEEFVAQHLAFFDASDGNKDGRITFAAPPIPIIPPLPPTPPTPK